jgi:hypothetical protein
MLAGMAGLCMSDVVPEAAASESSSALVEPRAAADDAELYRVDPNTGCDSSQCRCSADKKAECRGKKMVCCATFWNQRGKCCSIYCGTACAAY